MSDWNPAAYAAFRGERLRPALDLLARVGTVPDGDVVDLGCGDGAAGPALAARFPDRRRIGLDASPAMLERAAATGAYAGLVQADIALWQPAAAPGLIFSNAALHWLGHHAGLLPRLAEWLAPGGVLAVQMPANWDAPSHRLLRDAAARLFPDRFAPGDWTAPVAAPADYLRWLDPCGAAEVWVTTYHHRLAPAATGHPVRRFTETTAMRPFLACLSPEEGAALTAAYDAALAAAYPADAGGGVLFPFTRLFLMVTRPCPP